MFALFRFRRSVPPAVVDAALLDTLADADAVAAEEADAAFTPERADAQRAAIMARLGADADRRVLAFPPRLEADAAAVPPSPARPALGWMLTAAAAGLIVGVGTGHEIYSELPGAPAAMAPRPATTVAVAVAAPAVLEPDDDLLGEVDVALRTRGVEELQPLDALTPRVTLVAAR
jgi:hypothetical protein